MSADPLALSRSRVEAAKADTSGRVYRIYCDGVFDLCHLGHMQLFRQVKYSLGDPSRVHVIAGVCSDELVREYKGEVVLDHATRCGTVAACRWVDEVVPEAPWVINAEFIEAHKIDFVAHDAIPYTMGDVNDVYAFVKERGMFLETQRTEGISTSDIILKLLRSYPTYVQRNLDRGYSPEDLGLGAVATVRYNVAAAKNNLVAAVKKVCSKENFSFGAVKAMACALGTLLNPVHHVPNKMKKGTRIAVACSCIGTIGALAAVLGKNKIWRFPSNKTTQKKWYQSLF